MLILLSPAKTLNMSKSSHQLRATPPFAKDGEVLVQELAKLSLAGMKSLLGVSDAIARLNHERYQHWEQQPSKQAVLAFDGPAYKGLDAPSLSDEDLQWAQERLRILCGLYGILRPMDAIKPYRLDMSKKLANAKWKDLYAFWGGSLTLSLNAELLRMPEDERFVVNCASQEYFKAIQPADLAGPVYTMAFPGPSVFAKQARGAMVRYIIKERVTTPEGLKGFTGTSGEWQFDDGQSKHSEFVFVRTAGKATSKAAGKAAAKPAAQRRKPRSGSAPPSAAPEDDDAQCTSEADGQKQAHKTATTQGAHASCPLTRKQAHGENTHAKNARKRKGADAPAGTRSRTRSTQLQ